MWNRNPYEDVAEEAEDASAPGLRSLPYVLGWGVLVPLVIGWYAVEAWQTEAATLFGDKEDVELDGDAARAMAVAYGAVAVFLNGRNCWGAMGFWRTQKLMSVVSCLAFIGGVFCAVVFGFGGVSS